jgi:DNA-binding transcriptional LysR family regulator
MRFDLTTLNLVLAIAETHSITRGAEREHLALAAASKRLSDLETRLGVGLFERRARGVELTEAGRALVRHIRSLNAALHALESEVVEFSHGVKGHLRIAANASAIAETLPPDLAAFSQAHPLIRISLADMTSTEVQAAVAEGRADVGIFVPPLQDPRLTSQFYRCGQLAVVVPRDHVLAGAEAVKFEALLDFDVVGLQVGTSVQDQMHRQAASLGRTVKARLQVRGFDAIAQLVEAGLGVAVMPATVAGRLSRVFGIQVLRLDEPWSRRDHLLAVRTQPVLPTVVQRFIEALRLNPHPDAAPDSRDNSTPHRESP